LAETAEVRHLSDSHFWRCPAVRGIAGPVFKLERSGFRYQILMGDHVLLSGKGSGEKLALAEIVDFVNRSLVR
jgi:hypothetical protein